MILRTTAFDEKGFIPARYTCEGDDVNPPLEITGIPHGTRTLALIMDDPDAPGGVFDHWLVRNMPPHEPIAEGRMPGITGTTSFGKTGYGGPCPPSGTHRYFFTVYALDIELELPAGSGKAALMQAIEDHILASASLMGLYKKRNVATR